ncbi:hypothetical protein [Raineya sp.]|jgi:hypothetical protein
MKAFISKPATRLLAFQKAVWVQVLAFLNILLTKGLLVEIGVAHKFASFANDILFLLITTFYIIFIYYLFSFFTSNRLLLNLIIVCFTIAFIVASISENPFFDLELSGKKYYILAVHICYSIGTTIIIYFATLEIFREGMSVIERLWGSACIYFMIAWAFGGIYDIICIFNPTAMGFQHQLNLSSYMESIAYSVSVLGNFNPLYENTSILINRIAIIEAVWAHLFVVLVVGRLLAK